MVEISSNLIIGSLAIWAIKQIVEIVARTIREVKGQSGGAPILSMDNAMSLVDKSVTSATTIVLSKLQQLSGGEIAPGPIPQPVQKKLDELIIQDSLFLSSLQLEMSEFKEEIRECEPDMQMICNARIVNLEKLITDAKNGS